MNTTNLSLQELIEQVVDNLKDDEAVEITICREDGNLYCGVVIKEKWYRFAETGVGMVGLRNMLLRARTERDGEPVENGE